MYEEGMMGAVMAYAEDPVPKTAKHMFSQAIELGIVGAVLGYGWISMGVGALRGLGNGLWFTKSGNDTIKKVQTHAAVRKYEAQ